MADPGGESRAPEKEVPLGHIVDAGGVIAYAVNGGPAAIAELVGRI